MANFDGLDYDFLSALLIKERFLYATPFFEAFHAFPYAVIKGAVLSQDLYGNPYARFSNDLDILLRREDLDRAKEVLLNNGFVQGHVVNNKITPFTRQELIFQTSQSHQAAPFIKRANHKFDMFINIDINTSIFWGEYDGECDMNPVLSETVEAELFGISFKKLSPEMAFISLCLHHYKDMNSIYLLAVNGLNPNLFREIDDYIRNVPIDMDKLISLCNKTEASPYVYYCLWYTHEFMQDAALLPFMDKFVSQKASELLNTYGLCDSERRTWTIDFKDRLKDSFREKFYAGLDEDAQNKVRLNKRLMGGF